MPELWHILTLAENRGADWATDELLINNAESLRKQRLYKKWGETTERVSSAKEDIWVLSDQFRLVVDYDDAERIESISSYTVEGAAMIAGIGKTATYARINDILGQIAMELGYVNV